MDINKHWDDQTWLRTLNKLTDLGRSQQPTGYQQMGIFFYAIGRFFVAGEYSNLGEKLASNPWFLWQLPHSIVDVTPGLIHPDGT